MNALDVLLRQTQDAHSWTNALMAALPEGLWHTTPDKLESNMCWQVGHLVISEYYHAILVVTGFDAEITKKIDLRAYDQDFGYKSLPVQAVHTVKKSVLKNDLAFMQAKVLQNIASLTLQDLEANVEQPIKQKHPVAKTKFDAISWNIKHTMWHCGQMATIKRMVHEPYDYGISSPN